MVDQNTSVKPETENDDDDDEDAKVRRAYFAPAQVKNEAVAHIGTLHSAFADKLIFSFDPSKADSIPDNYGIIVQPISQRTESGNQLDKIAIVAVPSTDMVLGSDEGRAYAEKAILAGFATKIANAIRSAGETGYTFPKTLKEFLERKPKVSDDLSTFKALAEEFVEALKAMGLNKITVKVLRNCLQNRAFAQSQYPKMPQEKWEFLLDYMTNTAKERGLDASIFVKWKETRNTAQAASDVSDIDFDKLNTLLTA